MLAESIQQDLTPLGIHATLKPVAWGPFLEAIRQPHTVQSYMQGWEADFPDPENFLGALLSRAQWGSNNDSFYSNPQVEALLAEAEPVADMKKRYALYDQAEKIVVADAPWVFLYYPVTYIIRQPWVHDYVINPMRRIRSSTSGCRHMRSSYSPRFLELVTRSRDSSLRGLRSE